MVNSLQTFRDNLPVPSSRVKKSKVSFSLKMGPIVCTVTSVRNDHFSLRNSTEERDGSLESRKECVGNYVGLTPLNYYKINPLKPELYPICYMLALLGAHHFLHVSRIRVKLLTFRLLMS